METIEHGPFNIALDREATTRAHAAMKLSGAEECSCNLCRNFASQKPVAFPEEFVALLGRLGVDRNREIEVYSLVENQDYVLYAGWFYFVGHVEGEGIIQPSRLTEFRYYLIEGPAYLIPAFEGLPISRVEFQELRLPWSASIKWEQLGK